VTRRLRLHDHRHSQQEINAGLAGSKLKAQFAGMGAEVLPGSPADFGMLIAAETEKWAKVVRPANIKAP
jgi:hypothetical protein